MLTSEFDYFLPKELIAQKSVSPRDHSKMMVVNRATQSLSHAQFFDIKKWLRPGDLLVRNVSRVFRSRLFGWPAEKMFGKEKEIEVFLLAPLTDIPGDDRAFPRSRWHALIRPLKKLHLGQELAFGSVDTESFVGDVTATIVHIRADGSVEMQFDASIASVFAIADEIGHIPVPPYVSEEPKSLAMYQTVYASETGSVAAPTAGFHFTQKLIDELERADIRCADVVLHVGIGTFCPMKSETLEEHIMHEEYVELPSETIAAIKKTKKNGGRVIAVGTTTVRTLEGIYEKFGALKKYSGNVNLFIKPGFEFHVIDAMITNFHLPKSSLLVLVSAFAGKELIDRAYKEAILEKYRFFSFGDAMLIF